MKKSTIIIVAVLAGLFLLALVGLLIRSRLAPSKSEAAKVRLDCPVRGDLVEVVAAPGEVSPKSKVSISARISARIVELPFEEGGRVTKGDSDSDPPIPPSVLVRLDDTDLKAALRSTEAHRAAQAAELKVAEAAIASQKASIEGIRASLVEAKRDLDRHEQLVQSGDVSRSVYETAKCRFDELTAQLNSAGHDLASRKLNLKVIGHQLVASDAQVEQAADQLSHTTITSPIDGVIIALNAEVGELVMTGTMNNPGTVIMTVADLDKMLVVTEVNEADIGAVEVGQRATVSIQAFPDRLFTGVVESIALTGRGLGGAESKEFLVEVLLDPCDERLYSGLTAEVEIETRRHSDVLKIPSQAVLARRVDELPVEIRDGSADIDDKKTFATVVYRYKDGKAVVTPVTIGASDATHTVIRSGLSPDDRVVTGPYKALEQLEHDQEIVDERESSSETPATEPAKTQPVDNSTGGAAASAGPA